MSCAGRAWSRAALAACFGVAGLLYLELPLRAGLFPAPLVYGHPETWSGFWDIVLARQFQGDFQGLADLPARAVALAGFVGSQLGVLAWLVPPAFVLTALRFPRYALLSGVAVAVTCLFAAFYVNASIGRYYLGPALFAWSWLAIAAGVIVETVQARAGRPPRPRCGPAGPDSRPNLATTSSTGRPGPAASRSAHRSPWPWRWPCWSPPASGCADRWRAADRSGDTAMADWLDDAMRGLDRNAVVVSWWSYSTPLWYGTLVEGRRPDLLVVDDSDIANENLGSVEDVIDHYLGTRPVYVIRATTADLEALALRYVLEPAGRPNRRLPRHGNPGDPAMTAPAQPPARPSRPIGSRACRTSSRPTTRRRTSRGWCGRRSRRCRRSPRPSRSSPSTTGPGIAPARSRTASPPSTRASCAPSTTTSTAATAARCARASRPRATSSSPSRTATASSGSRTSPA